MPRPHKIKRSKPNKISYRARPHPLSVVLGVVLIAAFVFLGISIYQPVLDYFQNRANRPGASLPDLEEPDIGKGQNEQPVEPVEPPPPDRVEGLRAVYAPPGLLGDAAALAAFLDSLAGGEINAVMVDIKDQEGSVRFNTRNASAAAWGTVSETPYDIDALADALAQRGLHLVARMSAFRDEPAARGNTDNAIGYPGTDYLWLDNYADAGGKPWLNPYAPGTQSYLTELATEAVERGAAMVVLIDYQFPDGSQDANIDLRGYNAGSSRSEALRGFARQLAEALGERGGRLALYYPATSFAQADANQNRFGGGPEALLGDDVELQLGLLPYQFGAGYSSEDGLVLEQPLDDPAATVGAALGYVQGKLREDTALTALLQGGNEGEAATSYTAQTIQAQVQAAADMGVREYVLYCTDAAAYLIH